MKWIKQFHTIFFKGFSAIVATICIGVAFFGLGYYFLAYKTNIIPTLKIRIPQIVKGGQVTTSVIDINKDSPSYEDVSPVVSELALEIDLVEGQNTRVAGTDIFIKALKVDDLTGRGCLGGPLGCADRAELEVSRHFVRQNITLLSPTTAGVKKAEKDKALAFGYTISLLSIHDKNITIRVEIVE